MVHDHIEGPSLYIMNITEIKFFTKILTVFWKEDK
jgi:hypothetical protein